MKKLGKIIQRLGPEAGQTLIEPLLAIGVLGIVLVPFIASLKNLTISQIKYRYQTQAAQYAREGLEVAYNITVNATDWDEFKESLGSLPATFKDNGASPPELEITVTPELVGGRFHREIIISQARRDEAGNICEEKEESEEKCEGSEITPDSDTLRAISRVSWEEWGETKKVEFSTYLIKLEAPPE